LFNRLGGEKWAMEGSKRLGEHLQEKTISIIEKHQLEPLADGVREEIDYILKS
jgi:trimethylamine:corrinoid methyltransferase-like protein